MIHFSRQNVSKIISFTFLLSQDMSVLENSCKTCKYYVNWRNASINGNKLSMEGLQKLRDYSIPTSGSLRIDYVTYKVWKKCGDCFVESNWRRGDR